MTDHGFDPLIHEPERLRIAAALAALAAGDVVSVARLRDMTGLPPANLDFRLGELGRAGYVRTGTSGGAATGASAALTGRGRDALDRYATDLRRWSRRPGPDVRVGDADRDAAAAALAEHYAQGRLTFDELNLRLGVTLTARTYGELTRVTRDLPG
jgi:DNA-binding transcriptional ArsR family regulator